jgi:DnaJ-class molecular chaperone
MTKRIKCEVCKGNGWDSWYTHPGTADERLTARKCNHCKGTGSVDIDDPEGLIKVDGRSPVRRV